MKEREWIRVFGLACACSALVQCANRPGPNTGAGTPEETVGRFVWQDLVTDDIAASQRFYGELLGWEFEATTRLGKPYVLVRANDNVVAGMTSVARERADEPIAQWLSYLRVEDVDRAVAEAERVAASARPHYVLRQSSSSSPVGGPVSVSDAASVRASWLPYVRVQDPAALAQRASELGGRVLLAPSASVRNGGLAIVADPAGAAIALQKWPLGS